MIESVNPNLLYESLLNSRSSDKNLLALLKQFRAVFWIKNTLMPHLFVIGGQVSLSNEQKKLFGIEHISVTGNGFTPEAACYSLLGEAAEYLAQYEDYSDRITQNAKPMIKKGWLKGYERIKNIDLLPFAHVSSHKTVYIPADFAVRTSKPQLFEQAPFALSSGVAAGVSLKAAENHALNELIERDSVAKWWLGGQSAFYLNPKKESFEFANSLILKLRDGNKERQTQFLYLKSSYLSHTIVAFSFGRDDTQLAFGVASRTTLQEALEAVIRELGQMELAAYFSLEKLKNRGEESLTQTDKNHILRWNKNYHACAMLFPKQKVNYALGHSFNNTQNISYYTIDLTHKINKIPVVRVIAPQMQPFTTSISTQGFEKILTKHQAVAHYRNQLPFF